MVYASIEMQDEKDRGLDVESIEALTRVTHVHETPNLLIKLKKDSQKRPSNLTLQRICIRLSIMPRESA